MRCLVLVAVGLALSGAGRPALADGETAVELLRRGIELRRGRHDEAALDVFVRALAISPTAMARAQVALAEQALGRWVEAERDLRTALSAADDEWISRHRSALLRANEEIERHLGWLTVEVDVVGAEAHIDGRPIAAGAEERVVAGSAVLEVRANGYAPDIRHLDLKPGDHTRVSVALVALVVQSPPPPPHSVGVPPIERSVAVGPPGVPVATPIFATFGVASIALGTYFGIRAAHDASVRDAQCPFGVCTAAGAADDSDARTSATVATAAIGGGVASLAAGAAWWVLDSNHHASVGANRVGPPLMIGIGLAGIGVGTYFGLLTLEQRNERDASCSRGCTSAALAYDAESRRSATVSTIAFGTGVGALAGAVIWWLNGTRPGNWRALPLAGAQMYGVAVEAGME